MLSKVHRRSAPLVFACVLSLFLTAQEEKRLSVYTPLSSFSVTVQNRDGQEYVALLDVIQPIGVARWKRDGDKWRLGFVGEESQFQAGKNKAKIRGKNIDMGAPAIIENEMVFVPIRGLVRILPRLLNATVDFREPARWLIVGGANIDFNAELEANPSRLVLHFSRPVNPTIASEPGRLRLTFTKDPVTGAAATQNFADRLISSATFAEKNGAADLTIAATAPLLATFSDDNRTITLAAAPQAPIAQARPTPPLAPQPTAANTPATATKQTPAPPAPAQTPPRPRFLVVIDPAHGGEDRGALLAAGVEEKELTLVFARRLRSALERNGITSILLRDGDNNVSGEQRATASNTARAAVFVSVHAGNVGRGVRLYTARVGDTTLKPGALLPWDSAQATYLDESKALSGSVAAEMTKMNVPHAEASAQLQPLNHVIGAAIAVEFLPGKDGVPSLANAQYQQALCSAIAAAITAARNTLEARN